MKRWQSGCDRINGLRLHYSRTVVTNHHCGAPFMASRKMAWSGRHSLRSTIQYDVIMPMRVAMDNQVRG